MNIEELAFKNYYELINIQKIDLLLIIEFLQKDRKQWINQFTQTHNESVEIQKENQELKKQLEYLRSGEYYNQLRFENEMLQQVVDTNGVPSEVYDYIDCTHRNTELLKENQELKKQLEEYKEQVNKGLYNTCLPYTTGYNKAIKDKEIQQKEFIKYLEDEIEKATTNPYTKLSEYGMNRIHIYKEILQKYRSIIGENDV